MTQKASNNIMKTLTLKEKAHIFAEKNELKLPEYDEGGYLGINTKNFAKLLIKFYEEQTPITIPPIIEPTPPEPIPTQPTEIIQPYTKRPTNPLEQAQKNFNNRSIQ